MLDCQAAMRQLWDYLDGELSDERMAAVRAHLSVCARCYPHYEFERAFLSAVAATRRGQQASGTLRERVLSALQDIGWTVDGGR